MLSGVVSYAKRLLLSSAKHGQESTRNKNGPENEHRGGHKNVPNDQMAEDRRFEGVLYHAAMTKKHKKHEKRVKSTNTRNTTEVCVGRSPERARAIGLRNLQLLIKMY